ncbi:MAG: APC family permease [Candidatus Jordarchaeum sp.]|uniref:APC family permease n=1 Tax=Candidatus Jordarchaeum sp. TaxID=2823881 RepID=UPI00404ACEA5
MSDRKEKDIEGIIYERELIRQLGLLDAVMIGIGASIGAGIFAVLGLAYGTAGPAVILSFVFCGIASFLTGYSYSKMSKLFPESGASYTYIARAFKKPIVGVVAGATLWFAYLVSCSTYAVGFSNYLGYFVNSNQRAIIDFISTVYGLDRSFVSQIIGNSFQLIDKKIIVLALVAVFGLLNFASVSETGRTQAIIVLSKVAILIFFIVAGLTFMLSPRIEIVDPTKGIDYSKIFLGIFTPTTFQNAILPIMAVVTFIFIAYEGFDLIPTTGEEIRNPKRNVGRAIYITIIVVNIIYLFTVIVMIGLIPWYQAGASEAPLAEAIKQTWVGQWGEILVGLGGILSTASAFNATLFGTSRLAYVMSRDGVFPRQFIKLSRRSHVPYFSLIVASVISLVLALFGDLGLVAGLASSSFIIIFFLVNVSNYRLRSKSKSFWVIPFLGASMTFFALIFMSNVTLLSLVLWIGGFSVIYFVVSKFRGKQRPPGSKAGLPRTPQTGLEHP